MDFFCSLPASTAICTAMDRPRHRPIERSKSYYLCSSSETPFNPRHLQHEKGRKSSANNSKDHHILRRKSSADVDELKECAIGDSSRYLLSDKPFIESDALVPVNKPSSSNSAVILKKYSQSARLNNEAPVFNASYYTNTRPSYHCAPGSRPSTLSTRSNEYSPHSHSHSLSLSSSSSSQKSNNQQVVVLRVSIHCKGCEGKIRKHISKMKGVTSFDIDLTTKRVTVIGEVTPLGVLESVSRVKSAQLWPSSSSSSTAN
ncbi:hypothetical protein ACFE04_014832 [Oxalis oulophora]